MVLKRTLLQRAIPTGPVCTLTHINVDTAAFFEINIIKIDVRRDGKEPVGGFKGRIAMIEFKTQQEILPEDELPIAAEETKLVEVRGAHPTGSWERMHFH